MADPLPKQPTNVEWDYKDGEMKSAHHVICALLIDIRAELRKLNKTLTEASIFVNGKVG